MSAVEEFLAGPMFARWQAYPPLGQWYAEQRAHLAKFNNALRLEHRRVVGRLAFAVVRP
ncbi:MAG: hypothetical protein QM775_12820 [Pirellulales bacterium]